LKLRTAVIPALAAAMLVAPAAASAATLDVDRSCYGPRQAVKLSGGGFTAGGPVAVTVAGQQLGVTNANQVGEIAVTLPAPAIRGKRRTDTITATDQTNLSLIANVAVNLTSLNVKVTPRNGDPTKSKRIVARGFTTGRTLWAHVRRGDNRRNVKIGRLKGACRTIDVKRKLFLPNAAAGLYNVQFDTKRRYSAKTAPQVSFMVTVFHTFRPASASSTNWIQVD
jgi:hypothetical protein